MTAPDSRVLHIVVCGLSWTRLDPLLQHGLMPQLQQLARDGSRGVLRALQPQLAAQIEHSLLTGVPAHRHGLLHPLRFDGDHAHARHAGDARTAGLPEWMRAADRAALFVGWPQLTPCNDALQTRVPRLAAYDARLDARFPAEMVAQRVRPEQIGIDHLTPFFGDLPIETLEADPAARSIGELLAVASTMQGFTTWLMQKRDWRLCSLRIDFLDEAERLFGAFHPPGGEDIEPAARQRYQHVLTGFYRFFDMLLRRLVMLAGADATLLLHADEGLLKRPPRDTERAPVHVRHRARHDDRGALILAGRAVLGGTSCWAATTLDVAPTLNRLLGLDPGVSLPGRWLAESLDPEQLPQSVACASEPDASADAEFAHALLEERQARGETGVAFEGAGQADEVELMEALSLLQDGAVHEAMARLRLINERKPAWRRAILHRARAHLMLGQFDDAERWIGRFLELGVPDLRSHLALGQIHLHRGEREKALLYFFQAEQLQPEESVSHGQIADAYRAAERHDDARRAYERALHFDPAYAPALLGLAKLALIEERPDRAIEACLRALESDYRNADTHFHLGVSLARSEQTREAIVAFETSLKLDPAKWHAHEWLARLYRLLDDGALQAAEHAVHAKRLRSARGEATEAGDPPAPD
ncbi:MAG: tetratricopeptide repeat protein [Xanthomonadales bacterium]|nr:tetratricopeptide repeat protein [Xanthomonadales bacterium]